MSKKIYQEYLYTDASTSYNGLPGQHSRILVTNEFGQTLFEKELGDYSVNEAELLGIIACLKRVAPDKKIKIFTDSKIAFYWMNRPLKKKSKASRRVKKWLNYAKQQLWKTESTVEWISRDNNLAGLIFDERKN